MNKFDLLNEHEIKSKLKNKNFDVIYKEITGSTNSDAKKITGENNLIIVAGEQSAGRGRYGRSFSSKDGGLYFTIKICEQNKFFNIEDTTFYPLIAATATCVAIYDLCGVNLFIKWPNDLLYKSETGYKKIVGILTEASIQADKLAYIIAGIGVNVNIDEFDENLKDIATSLKIITGKNFDRADLLCEIVENFMEITFSSRENLLEEYKKRLLTDINIKFTQNGSQYIGQACGINESGNLLAKVNGQIITVLSGEINFL